MVATRKLAGKKGPQLPKKATGFVETSTTRWDGNDAVAQWGLDRGQDPSYAIPRDAINSDLRLQGSPLIRLTGDEFVTSVESQLNLLADLTATVGSGPLTNNNAVTFATETVDDESSLYEQTVGNFASTSSQYLSLPTGTSVQVGTNSFLGSIAFKTNTTGALQVMASYGSHVAAKAYWEFRINAANILAFEIWDGTTTNTVTDTIASRWQDNRWHIVTALVDKTLNIIYLICDGISIGSVAVTASNTLTIAGENLYIGAYKTSGAAIAGYFNGSLALFKLINNSADYNVPAVWNMGIREGFSTGTFTVPTTDANKRLNQKFGTPNSDLYYAYTTAPFEDGEYEIQVVYEKSTAGGKLDILIDDNTIISGLDTYNGSTTHNNVSKYYGVKIADGRHYIKIKNNGKNGSSSGNAVNLQWINFIKRRGHENGGSGDFLLLSDEINERSNTAWVFGVLGSGIYNNEIFQSSASNLNYTEGSIFIKGGLYRIDYIYETYIDRALVDVWIGNTQIISLLDCYGGAVENNIKTVYVRLQQGKNNIRISANGKNASSSNYYVIMQGLRAVRLSD